MIKFTTRHLDGLKSGQTLDVFLSTSSEWKLQVMYKSYELKGDYIEAHFVAKDVPGIEDGTELVFIEGDTNVLFYNSEPLFITEHEE